MKNLDTKIEYKERLMPCEAPYFDMVSGVSDYKSKESENIYSEDTLQSISKLGDTLKRIKIRMGKEGYKIQNGIIVKI